MKQRMVRYKLKADRVAENEQYLQNVFEQLQREQPSGLRYAAFKLDDGVSFVHIVELDTPDGSNPAAALESFRAYTAEIQDRCEEPPVFSELANVGSYKLFGE